MAKGPVKPPPRPEPSRRIERPPGEDANIREFVHEIHEDAKEI